MIFADDYVQAIRFAAQAHHGQTFPGTELPYLLHVTSVAAEVSTALIAADHGQMSGRLAVLCAVLHDTLEDTPVSFGDVEAAFGRDVADGVQALTKDETLPKPERMPDSLARIRQQPPAVWLVKLADRTVNMNRPPDYWPSDKRARYRDEARVILDALGDASDYQRARLATKIEAYGAFL